MGFEVPSAINLYKSQIALAIKLDEKKTANGFVLPYLKAVPNFIFLMSCYNNKIRANIKLDQTCAVTRTKKLLDHSALLFENKIP